MNNAEYKILLIEFSGSNKKILLQMLMDLGFNVNNVNTIESAIQKVLSFSPDLVICVDDLGEYTGFQIYNMLEREIFKKGAPFILVLEEFSQTNISMGQDRKSTRLNSSHVRISYAVFCLKKKNKNKNNKE